MNTSYAVTNPEGNLASGRAEETIFFYKNLHFVQLFVKKEKYHAAAGESDFWSDTGPGQAPPRNACNEAQFNCIFP